ncbi:winged helix-turn-helix domain-containing protein [Erysipelatoclostridium ramosum]|uniref:winged helix-turn-helix domain-containing protein n=1 Tax=Thomasclavelia ramosa TaxID=1547 RepID=UPI001C3885AD|nr:winged helix-turn-helix domain-containing protein [Thomasclavelia ramosa]MBV4108517.1 winged helix-turn-helix domain-containing protein [Thomasclavelia ramosa]MCB5407457.1 winged helix-turn-helix domain-containing protein [Thomasclavelia ramosa]
MILEVTDTNEQLFNQVISLVKNNGGILSFDSKSIEVNGLQIKSFNKSVYKNGNKIYLTSKEYQILYLLASHIGRVFSREQIYEEIWNEPSNNCVNSIENMISRLRKKLKMTTKILNIL